MERLNINYFKIRGETSLISPEINCYFVPNQLFTCKTATLKDIHDYSQHETFKIFNVMNSRWNYLI